MATIRSTIKPAIIRADSTATNNIRVNVTNVNVKTTTTQNNIRAAVSQNNVRALVNIVNLENTTTQNNIRAAVSQNKITASIKGVGPTGPSFDIASAYSTLDNRYKYFENIFYYGVVSGSGTDQAAAIDAALTTISALGVHTVFFPKGVYKISTRIYIPANLTIVGEGMNGTIFSCSTVDAGLWFGDEFSDPAHRRDTSGHFNINANSKATYPFEIGHSTNEVYDDIRILNSAAGGAAVYINGTQNFAIYNLEVSDYQGYGWLFDRGCATGRIYGGHTTSDRQATPSSCVVADDNSLPVDESGRSNPETIYWHGHIFETSTLDPVFDLRTAHRWTLESVISNSGGVSRQFKIGRRRKAQTNRKRAITSNVATITTYKNHTLDVGDSITIENEGAPWDGVYTVVSIPTTKIYTVALVHADVAEEDAIGQTRTPTWLITNHIMIGHGCKLRGGEYFIEVVVGGSKKVSVYVNQTVEISGISRGLILYDDYCVLYFESIRPAASIGLAIPQSGAIKNGSDIIRRASGERLAARIFSETANVTRALASNVVTITTDAAHNLQVGDLFNIQDEETSFWNVNTQSVVSVPTTTSYTFALTHADVAEETARGKTILLAKNRTSTTTLADSIFLNHVIDGRGYFRIRSMLIYEGDTAGDLKVHFTAPTATGTNDRRAKTSDIVTITTDAVHGLISGDSVSIASENGSFNGDFYILSTPTSKTFTYYDAGIDIAEQNASGTYTGPSTLLDWWLIGPPVSLGSGAGQAQILMGSSSLSSAPTTGASGAGNKIAIIIEGLGWSPIAGTLMLQWAQATSSATPTYIYRRSNLEFRDEPFQLDEDDED